ncbi:hypothetical protein CEE37_05760 [candidate division LCP-89 bacterium B3_LCP]|uniref:Uncharacterized protein n=1 Tax=candidate division LCP-89 bacterium B3_LCP TaxID=2012998 RepID=A0A532V1S3_UNCL8|nr:MAG: hypothetical protein CEE37_05760 [candidate division LCP-89 bacterium B3_LCP]
MENQINPTHQVFINQFVLWRLVQNGEYTVQARSLEKSESESIPILLSFRPPESDDSDRS